MYILYIHKHIYTHTFLHLHWGDQQAGDVDVVAIFILIVQHQVNFPSTLHLSPSLLIHGPQVQSDSLILDAVVNTGLWARQISCSLANPSPFCPFDFPATRHQPGAAFSPELD